LLNEPDPVADPLNKITDFIRKELKANHSNYSASYKEHLKNLISNPYWSKLNDLQQATILSKYDLNEIPKVDVTDQKKMLSSLEQISLSAWTDKLVACRVNFKLPWMMR